MSCPVCGSEEKVEEGITTCLNEKCKRVLITGKENGKKEGLVYCESCDMSFTVDASRYHGCFHGGMEGL